VKRGDQPVRENPTTPAFGGKAVLVSAALAFSRVLGLVREQVFAAVLGATAYADAFTVAFRIPNLLRDLFAEGTLAFAFTPTFAEHFKRSREAAFRLGSIVIGALGLTTGLVTLVGIFFAPDIVSAMAPGFANVPGKFKLTVSCTRIMFPFLPIVAIASVAMGALNAQEKFGPPAFASAVFNLVAIGCGIGLLFADVDADVAVIGWSVGTLLGGAAQLLVQIPPLRRTGFSFRPKFVLRDPGLARIGRLMAPAVLGLGATQLNVLVNTMFASEVEGGASWLNYAFRLMQFPIGVFGMAVATITTTGLAKCAAAADLDGVRSTLGSSLRLVALLTIPSTAGLIALREPIVRLLFERGRFDSADTIATGQAVLMYSVGLFAFSAVKVVAPAFYALNRPRIPLLGTIAAVAVNVLFSVALFPALSFRGLALGTSLGIIANLWVLVWSLHASVGFGIGLLADHLFRVILAAIPCAAVAWVVSATMVVRLGSSFPSQLATLAGAISLGTCVFVYVAKLLGIREVEVVLGTIRARLANDR
jgi:putative peptidoglycan lipid II flippase